MWAADFITYSASSSGPTFPMNAGGVSLTENGDFNVKNQTNSSSEISSEAGIPSTKIYMISFKGGALLDIDAGESKKITSITIFAGRNSTGNTNSQFGHGGFSNNKTTWSEISALSAKGYDYGTKITITPTGNYRYYSFGRGALGSTSPAANAEARIYKVIVNIAATCTNVAAPTGLSCTAHTKNSLTFSWTAADNASKYTATLYSDAECTDQVTQTTNIATTSVTFSTLSGSTTYYCKVQSNGDGSTYCSEGGVTDAASGTTDGKAYTVTATSNNALYGSAASSAGSLDEDETATITATPESGYKFVSWEVSGTGSSLSSDTDNPTTLTMGTADATVTATFRALEHYTITYNKGAYGSGDAIAAGDKTEDADFTLTSSKYTRDGYAQIGWATVDGAAVKEYAIGGTYATNANLTLYPVWKVLYTQRTVSTAETWDWSEATGDNVNLTNETTPQKDADADIVAANFDGEIYAGNCGFPSNFDAIVMYKFQRPKNGSYYQGQTIKIHTDVPGTITVTFANTGSKRPNRYLSVNGTIHGEGSGDENSASQKTVTVPVAAGDITLTGIYEPTESNYKGAGKDGYQAYDAGNAGNPQYLNYYKIVFIPAHEREVASGKYATVCLPRAIVSADGIDKFYTVAGYRGTANDITSVVIAEAETPLTAGKPYIFHTSAAAQTIYLKGDAVNAPVAGENGLVGRFTDGTITDNDCSYILRNNEVCKVDGDDVTCVANRAYFNFYGLDPYAGAPGRFIELPMAPNSGTDINNIEASEEGVKFIREGKLFIKKNGVVYDALGRMVK